jgi:hydrogenase maturation protease
VTDTARDLVVIGVGNVLRGDDAVGVHVVEGLRSASRLDASCLPADTRLVDGGTLGLDLLRTIRDARGLVLVDAARLGGSVGTVSVLRDDEIAGDGRGAASPGAVGELVAVARLLGWLPAHVALVAVEAGDTEVGLALSAGVGAALGPAMDAVLSELQRMDGQPTGDPASAGVAAGMAGASA